MAIKTEAEAVSLHSGKVPSALSEEERAALQGFYKKHRELIENADALSQPMKEIAEFVKKEVGMEKPSVGVMHARERYERRAYGR